MRTESRSCQVWTDILNCQPRPISHLIPRAIYPSSHPPLFNALAVLIDSLLPRFSAGVMVGGLTRADLAGMKHLAGIVGAGKPVPGKRHGPDARVVYMHKSV